MSEHAARAAMIADVEAAVRTGSIEKNLDALAKVTDLFLATAGSFSNEQIELFGDVLDRLVGTIELRALADMAARIALAELSSQFATVSQAPPAVVRRLARNDEISIAGPVLQESSRLDDDDLVELARSKGEKHLLAIAGRCWLKEVVTDALVARSYPSVSRRAVNNPGARFSAAGFAMLISQSQADPELAVQTGVRADLPTDLRTRLLQNATEAVRARLLASAPPHLFDEIRSAIASVSAEVGREMSKGRDFASAVRHVAMLKDKGQLDEAALFSLARGRRYEETVAALAVLSRSSVEVIRPLMQSLRNDGVLVPCKAAGLGWETVIAVLESRYVSGSLKPDEVARAKAEYAKLDVENARRLLRFWQVRT